MRFGRVVVFLVLVLSPLAAEPLPRARTAEAEVIRQDLLAILGKANLPVDTVTFDVKLAESGPHRVEVSCPPESAIRLHVSATQAEWGPAFYYGLPPFGLGCRHMQPDR